MDRPEIGEDLLQRVFHSSHPSISMHRVVGAGRDDGMSEPLKTSAGTANLLQASVEERTELARLLLYSLPTPNLCSLLQSVEEEIKVDFITYLPQELACTILYQLEAKDLIRCGLVSTSWRTRCVHDQRLWKMLYIKQGWTYDRKAVQYWNESSESVLDEMELQVTECEADASDDDGLGSDLEREYDADLDEADSPAAIKDSALQFNPPTPIKLSRLPEWDATNIASSPILAPTIPKRFVDSTIRKYNIFKGIYGGSKAPRTLDLLRISPHHYTADRKPCVNFRHLYRLQTISARNLAEGHFTISDIQTPPNKIDAEGQPVLPNTTATTVRENHSYCLQFDGTRLLVGNRDSYIRQYDTSTGRQVRRFAGHTKSVLSLQYENGYENDPEQPARFPILVTGSSDFTCRVWNLDTTECVHVLQEHTDSVLDVCFQAQDNILATCSKDRTVKLWTLFPAVECTATLRGHRGAVNAIKVRNGLVCSVSGDRQARIWSTETYECLRIMEGHTGGIASLWFDGRMLITGSSDSFIRLTDVENGELQWASSADRSQNPTGSAPPVRVRTVSNPIHNGPPMNGYDVRTDLIRTVQSDQRFIVTGSYDKSIKIFDRVTGSLICHVVGAQPTRIFALQFDASRIIACSEDGQVRVFDYLPGEDTSFLI